MSWFSPKKKRGKKKSVELVACWSRCIWPNPIWTRIVLAMCNKEIKSYLLLNVYTMTQPTLTSIYICILYWSNSGILLCVKEWFNKTIINTVLIFVCESQECIWGLGLVRILLCYYYSLLNFIVELSQLPNHIMSYVYFSFLFFNPI